MVVQPLVSILLPAFNAAATLPACLRSIQRQSETRWECVIVDDGSCDVTIECARSFARLDERFTVVGTPHRGIVSALNTGLQRCRGAFVARMDADDLMRRERLAVQVEALERCGCAAMGCHVRLFPRAALADGRVEYERWLNSIDSSRRVRAESFVECPIAHPALMIRTAVLRRFGYRDQGWPEDYDLVLRLLASGHDLGVVPRRLICWRDAPNRLSRTHPSYAVERFTACKAAFLAAGLLAAADEYALWGYGETGRALRRALLAYGKRPACIVEVHPGRLGNTIHGAPVIAPEHLADRHRYPVVASVAGAVARQRIRAAMQAMGFEETRDFICAA
jgi:glycosyltransferase involved in cell wall biosynthesis